jgi:acetyl-CoA carboxylase carboxyl transferase subunit beta
MALERLFRRRPAQGEARDVPDLWVKCPKCEKNVYKKDLEANSMVCTNCAYHLRLPADKRVELLADQNSFKLITGLKPADPLGFVDTEPYPKKLERYQREASRPDAIVGGSCTIGEVPSVLMVMDINFAGGSMGSVVGEELTRGIELAAQENRAVVIVAASGGARMQEAALSLMQMAKTTLALDRIWAKRLPYVSILSDPTTGGVTASFAALADVILTEPGALIGFAGPRVIKQTIRQDLPEGFQRAEFLLKHGMVDKIVDRRELKDTLATVLKLLHPGVLHAS